MRVTVLAGMLLLLAAPAYADELPDTMMGWWDFDGENGETLVRRDGDGEFHVSKDSYMGVDDICRILKVEKQTENLYALQASCTYVDKPKDDHSPPTIRANEFELVGKDKLLITPVGS
jgi:hypothetical protein